MSPECPRNPNKHLCFHSASANAALHPESSLCTRASPSGVVRLQERNSPPGWLVSHTEEAFGPGPCPTGAVTAKPHVMPLRALGRGRGGQLLPRVCTPGLPLHKAAPQGPAYLLGVVVFCAAFCFQGAERLTVTPVPEAGGEVTWQVPGAVPLRARGLQPLCAVCPAPHWSEGMLQTLPWGRGRTPAALLFPPHLLKWFFKFLVFFFFAF